MASRWGRLLGLEASRSRHRRERCPRGSGVGVRDGLAMTIFQSCSPYTGARRFVQSSFQHPTLNRMFSLTPRAERVVSYAHLSRARPLVPLAARLPILSRASRLQRPGWGSTRAEVLLQRPDDDVGDRRNVRRPFRLQVVTEHDSSRYPDWAALEAFASRWPVRIGWGTAYALLYLWLATAWCGSFCSCRCIGDGPVHGAIVNWCGPPLRLPELRDETSVAELSTVGLPHLRRAVPEQPSPRSRPAEFAAPLVRVRSDLRGAPCPSPGREPSVWARRRSPA